jgi:phosphate starvation-inducible membrane PsiE
VGVFTQQTTLFALMDRIVQQKFVTFSLVAVILCLLTPNAHFPLNVQLVIVMLSLDAATFSIMVHVTTESLAQSISVLLKMVNASMKPWIVCVTTKLVVQKIGAIPWIQIEIIVNTHQWTLNVMIQWIALLILVIWLKAVSTNPNIPSVLMESVALLTFAM